MLPRTIPLPRLFKRQPRAAVVIGALVGVLAVLVVLGWVTGAAAVTPLSSCGTTIAAPGSFMLTGNLSSLAGTCIVVAADGVTIDLKGFVINDSGASTYGIADNGVSHKSIVVRNGTIRGFNEGIYLNSSTSVLLDHMILTKNGYGVTVGAHSTVKNSTIHDNTSASLLLGDYSSLTDSMISNNGDGVNGGNHVTVARVTVAQNGSVDSSAIALGDYASVQNSVVQNNTEIEIAAIFTGNFSNISFNRVLHNAFTWGIAVGTHSTVKGNVVNDNGDFGIVAATNSSLSQNVAIDNGQYGIDVFCPSTVKYNTAFGSSVSNLFESGSGCTSVHNNAP